MIGEAEAVGVQGTCRWVGMGDGEGVSSSWWWGAGVCPRQLSEALRCCRCWLVGGVGCRGEQV